MVNILYRHSNVSFHRNSMYCVYFQVRGCILDLFCLLHTLHGTVSLRPSFYYLYYSLAFGGSGGRMESAPADWEGGRYTVRSGQSSQYTTETTYYNTETVLHASNRYVVSTSILPLLTVLNLYNKTISVPWYTVGQRSSTWGAQPKKGTCWYCKRPTHSHTHTHINIYTYTHCCEGNLLSYPTSQSDTVPQITHYSLLVHVHSQMHAHTPLPEH